MKPGQVDRILVALRPRQRGLPAAAEHARVLAERFDADLIVMSAVYDSSVAAAASRGSARSAAARDGMIEAEKASLERLASSLRDWGIGVETDVRWHAPMHEAVLQAVSDRHADLLVVDALETQPVVHTRLTDTDWQLMRSCPCPLLFVNDPGFANYETILAAIDPLHPGPATDRTDRAVLAAAIAFGRAFDAKVRVLHVYPDPEVYSWVSSIEVSPGIFLSAENIEAFHRQAVEEAAEAFGIGPERVDLEPGNPRAAIADAAASRRASLVVLGALERGRMEQAFLGSTAEAIVADADCDVLLVKPLSAVAV